MVATKPSWLELGPAASPFAGAIALPVVKKAP